MVNFHENPICEVSTLSCIPQLLVPALILPLLSLKAGSGGGGGDSAGGGEKGRVCV